MMIGDFAVVDHLGKVAGNRKFLRERECFRNAFDQRFGAFFHMAGQIPAVGTGIAGQFLFVQALGIIQRLLRRRDSSDSVPQQGRL